MTTAIKICGITSLADAEAAVEAGATHLGLIFVEGSKRAIELPAASEIAARIRGRAKLVAVFRGAEAGRVRAVADAVGVDLVQYHGGESRALMDAVGLPAIKVIELPASSPQAGGAAGRPPWMPLPADLSTHVVHLLFDRPKAADDPGWLAGAVESLSAGAPLSSFSPAFFAGGLTPESVGLVVGRLAPYGVDVASGVETSPGVKDHNKVRAFCAAVREAALNENAR